MSTGEIIKDLLNKTGKSQADLARFLGVKPNTVNRWIPTDKKKGIDPSEKNLKKIAEFFQVSIGVLKGEAGEIGSIEWHRYIQKKQRKNESFELFLESLGYELSILERKKRADPNVTIKHYQITWHDKDGNKETRYIKAIDFDMFLIKLEKHINIEIENYY